MDIQRHTEDLYKELIKSINDITRKAVQDVVEDIAENHPQLDDAGFELIRADVMRVFSEQSGLFAVAAPVLIVRGFLEKEGILPEEKIPVNIEVELSVLERLKGLGIQDKYAKTVAYIILNSANNIEVRRKIVAAHFTTDATQLLMPLLHQLAVLQPELKNKVKKQLRTIEGIDALPNADEILEKYCFEERNYQPYVVLAFDTEIGISSDTKKELHDTFVAIMLEHLKAYLTS